MGPSLLIMSDEQVFTVSGTNAVRAERATMAQAGLVERHRSYPSRRPRSSWSAHARQAPTQRATRSVSLHMWLHAKIHLGQTRTA